MCVMETAMKERPILFSGPMVRAILAGKKTQTRRVIKPQPLPETDAMRDTPGTPNWWAAAITEQDENSTTFLPLGSDQQHNWKCPYGRRGDVLWIREAFSAWFDARNWYDVAKDFRQRRNCTNLFYRATHNFPDDDQKWAPGIFMPRWASRLTLEITDVRVERLQEISEADAQTEGVERPVLSPDTMPGMDPPFNRVHPMTGHYRDGFRELWDKLNGPRGYGWDSNPFVWVISFKRVDT